MGFFFFNLKIKKKLNLKKKKKPPLKRKEGKMWLGRKKI
jgi:hypothetical protein